MNNPIISSFIQSGLFGKLIIVALFFLSVVVWTIIQTKWSVWKDLKKRNKIFFNSWNSKTQKNIFQPIEKERIFKGLPVFEIYQAAKEDVMLIVQEERSIESSDIEAIGNSLARIIARTKLNLEEGITSLATITTIAPFLGLLGTVWGVMNSFLGMGEMGNASIAAVAPGISESLVTTAVGLIVAIPSSVAFNYAKNKAREEVTLLNNFALEIMDTIERKYVAKGIKN